MASWQTLATKAARQVGIDPGIFRRLVYQESSGNPTAQSPKGAYGYTQLMPGTAASLGVNPRDPWQNLLGGARYLKQQLSTFGNYSDALRAYNAGPGAVKASHGYAETNNYVKNILGGTGGSGATGGTTGSGTANVTLGGSVAPDSSGVDVSALLQVLQNQTRTAPSSAGIPAPSFVAGPAMPKGYQDIQTAGAPQSSSPDINQLLALVRTQGGADLTGTAGGSSSTGTTPAGGGTSAPAGAPAKGLASFGGKQVAAWIEPALAWAKQHGWQGTVISGYRTYAKQQQIYDSGVRPAAKPGTSNHEFTTFPGGAVDVSNPQQLAQILASSPYRNRLIWAGAKDPAHFSHPHNGGY